MPKSDHDDFYVGYLPLPSRHRRFLKVLVPVLLLGIVGLGVVIGLAQKDPGAGVWETDKEITVGGVVTIDPYAILHTQEAGNARALVLVLEGKFGAAPRLQPFANQYVSLKGTLLHRDGRSLFEIADSPDAVAAGKHPEPAPAVPLILGPRTCRGEIVDPKCYIGAMKPGGGKTHKACAQLCLAGGIPPMLAVWENGQEFFYLLVAADGNPLNDQVSPLAGESVDITGIAELRDDLLVLRVQHMRQR